MQSRDGNYALYNNIYHWKGLLSLDLTNICYVSFITSLFTSDNIITNIFSRD